MRASVKAKILIWTLVLGFFITAIHSEMFITSSQTDFDEGIYNNTYCNTTNSAVQLNTTAGTYTSRIFDANTTASWNSITFESALQTKEKIFVVDGQKKVFASLDMSNWTTQTADYGGTIAPDGLAVIPNNELIILDNKAIYHSSNEGINWTLITSTFTPYSNDGIVMTADKNYYLYIIDGAQRVFKSTNYGYNWTKINDDFNGAISNDVKGITITSNNTLFAVDGAGNVYFSSNQGTNWTYMSNYGGGAYTDALAADENDYLYILNDKDIHQSTNAGQNWTKINDQFTPYSNNGILMFFDKKSKLIIVDGIGRTFASTNHGINWTELGDCNSAATNQPKTGTAILYQTNISLTARSCDDNNCTEESFTSNLSVPNNRYFQYKFNLEADNADYSPRIYNVTINYSLINTGDTIPPSVNNITPLAGTNFSKDSVVDITANVTDDIAVDTVSANITNPDLSVLWLQLFDDNNDSIYNNTIIANQSGIYYITIIANDTSGNINNTETTHFDPASLGGGSSGGGGAAAKAYQSIPDWRKKPSTFIIPPKNCTESWLCAPWSECKEGQQTRTCEDWNKCGTAKTKPLTDRPCEQKNASATKKKPETTPRFAITPLLPPKQTSAVMGSAGIVAIIILLFISIFLVIRKTGKKPEKKLARKSQIVPKLKSIYKLK